MERDPGSFRDRSGFVYRRDGVLLRQVDVSFARRWDELASSGLLEVLQRDGLLIGHDVADRALAAGPERVLGIGPHLHAHARAGSRGAAERAGERARLSPLKREALIDSLRRTIEGLPWRPNRTAWSDYADETSYSDTATAAKDRTVERLLAVAGGSVAWDLGANTGRFSRIAASGGRRVVAWDADPVETDRHYQTLTTERRRDILPLVVDLTNPSPGAGWAAQERRPLADRADADIVIALALVHHLAIGANIPLPHIAAFFASLGARLVAEFVPREDPMVGRMLADREDVFIAYTEDGFRSAFDQWFRVLDASTVEDSTRLIYLFERRTRT